MLGLTMMYNLEGSDAWMRWVLTALPKGERDERKLEDGKSGFIQMPTFGQVVLPQVFKSVNSDVDVFYYKILYQMQRQMQPSCKWEDSWS